VKEARDLPREVGDLSLEEDGEKRSHSGDSSETLSDGVWDGENGAASRLREEEGCGGKDGATPAEEPAAVSWGSEECLEDEGEGGDISSYEFSFGELLSFLCN
jgi:hypothetical protein